jgi:hypothetical protein
MPFHAKSFRITIEPAEDPCDGLLAQVFLDDAPSPVFATLHKVLERAEADCEAWVKRWVRLPAAPADAAPKPKPQRHWNHRRNA